MSYIFNKHIQKILPNEYGGSEKKRTIILNDNNKYLLKLPDPTREIHREISYINNAISEYIGCKIAKSMGLPVQEVIIGEFFDFKAGKTKIACACKDIRMNGMTMHQADLLELELSEMVETSASFEMADRIIDDLNTENADEIKRLYRDQFILDTLINNKDRHNGNWAVLYDGSKYYPCSIYDCGSSLFPLLSDEEIQKVNPAVLALGSCSALSDKDGNKINYHNFWTQQNEDKLLNEELLKIVKNISITKITDIIDNCPYISDVRKNFYKCIITCNYEKTIIPAVQRLTSIPQKSTPLSPAELFDFYKENIKWIKNSGLFTTLELSEEYMVMKINNRQALILNSEGKCTGVLPIRSNNDDVRTAINILHCLSEKTPQIETEIKASEPEDILEK